MAIIGKGGFNGVSGKAYFGDIYSAGLKGSDQEIYSAYHNAHKITLAERGTYNYGGKTGEGQIYTIETREPSSMNNPFPHSQYTYAFLADCAGNDCPTGYKCCKTTVTTNYITRNLNACIKDNPAVYLDKMHLVTSVRNAEMYGLEDLWASEFQKAMREKDICKMTVARRNLDIIWQAMDMREGLTPRHKTEVVGSTAPTTTPSIPSGQPSGLPSGQKSFDTGIGSNTGTITGTTTGTTTQPIVSLEISKQPANQNMKIFLIVAVIAVIGGIAGYSIYSMRK